MSYVQVQRYRCVRSNRGVHEWLNREGNRSRGDEFHGQPYIRRINVLIHCCWFIETLETTLTDRSGIQLNYLLRDTAVRVNVARIKPLHIPFNRVLLMVSSHFLYWRRRLPVWNDNRRLVDFFTLVSFS